MNTLTSHASRPNAEKQTVSQTIMDRISQAGLLALDGGKYQEAIHAFESLIDIEEDWHARMWLATAYVGADMNNKARHQLIYICERCPLAELRSSAFSMLRVIGRN